VRRVFGGYSPAHNFVREASAVAGSKQCKITVEQIP